MAEASRPGGAGGAAAWLRRVGRWLELRSFGLTPEHFALQEGARAALIVALPLALILILGEHRLSWAIFAAFWLCLSDIAGPSRLRHRLLLVFCFAGAVVAFLGAWAASLGTVPAMLAGPMLVFLSILLPIRLAHSQMLATLLAVVAVVAVGFPASAEGAMVLALAFLSGGLWASLVIARLWRIDPVLALRQDSVAMFARLSDMAFDLAATGIRPHRDRLWHPEHAAHRRSIRIAIERLRVLISRYEGDAQAEVAHFCLHLREAEACFNALIALEHAFITDIGSAEERIASAKVLRNALMAARMTVAEVPGTRALLARRLTRLARGRAAMEEPTIRGVLSAVDAALAPLARAASPAEPPLLAAPPLPSLQAGLRQALRQAVSVAIVRYVALSLGLGYPYWAIMATVVVMQSAARTTWTRSLERIFGSLLGGAAALGLLHLAAAPPILALIALPLAGLTIALRTVNYTIFVVTLTMLFILVTELLQPGAGSASARILDNLLGSFAALFCVLALWPDRGPSLPQLIAQGLKANGAYLDAVRRGESAEVIEATRRAAGLSSIAAEVALHDLGGIPRRWHRQESHHAEALRSLRLLAGEAAAVWHAARADAPAPRRPAHQA
ncbi:hypothetical protein BJF93_13425 [Xaviernesmea oryzae]|uniref:Integral membrane bound transporter domain-containing protein n=1 Tax=Xaviernesmea oryzae TaxID=464029 RepID=A0A1Q9ARG3_9HYPH|nr:hypothetical protein BJF93_13425 [Xaviernesmea oryzae]